MLVSTMNVDEVCRELLLEWEPVSKRGLSLAALFNDELKRKHLTKGAKTTQYVSPRNNTWLFIFTRTDGTHVNPVLYFYNESGITAYHIAYRREHRLIIIQTGHFFKRYHERLALDMIKPLEVVKYYFRHNDTYQPAISHTADEHSCLCMTEVNGGAALGYYIEEKNYLCMKTFVSHEMLGKSQKNILECIRINDPLLMQQFETARSGNWELIKHSMR